MGPRLLAAAALLALALVGAPAAEAKGPSVALAEGARAGAWVARPAAPLRLVDPSDGRVIASVAAGRLLRDVAARYGTVWAVSLEGRSLVRVDETSPRATRRRVTGRRRLPVDLAWKVAASDRSVWVVGTFYGRRDSAVLLRVDPATLRVVGTFHLGSPEPPDLAVGHGAVWLAMNASSRRGNRSTVVGIDERTGRLRARRRVAGAPIGVASGNAGVWLLAERGRRASRLTLVDARGGGVVRSAAGPAGANGLAAGSDLVWVTSDSVTHPPRQVALLGYDEATAGLVSGPWSIACGAGRRPTFPLDLLAGGDTALVAITDGRGRAHLATVTVRGGLRRCVQLAG